MKTILELHPATMKCVLILLSTSFVCTTRSQCTHTYSDDNKFVLVEPGCFGSSGQSAGNSYCLSTFGAFGATILNAEDSATVAALCDLSATQNWCYTGLYNITSATKFEWYDGTPVGDNPYTNWRSIEPHLDGTYTCGGIYKSDDGWVDASCTWPSSIVCNKNWTNLGMSIYVNFCFPRAA